ncbi:hypothetical protein SDC9_65809 [bioreactor metagenome]|uniref:Uncharacterized protein n=1 Tax=bioreactor metagenome TaxID=1076179 RepID=A0A644XT45_9ZZZZ
MTAHSANTQDKPVKGGHTAPRNRHKGSGRNIRPGNGADVQTKHIVNAIQNAFFNGQSGAPANFLSGLENKTDYAL